MPMAGGRRDNRLSIQSSQVVRDLLLRAAMRARPEISLALLTLAVALAPNTVRAATAVEAESSTFEERPTALYLLLGLGTPVGGLGLEAERMLSPMGAVAAGAGIGANGVQAAAMARLLLGGSRSRLVLGAGISGGHYRWVRLCTGVVTTCPNKQGDVVWANLELGGAYRSRAGFSLRYFLGYGRIVAGNYDCVGESRAYCLMNYRDDGKNLIYVGLALGYAF